MSTLEDLRARLSAFYISAITAAGVHSVTFQPYHGKKNEDRVVTEDWDIHGQRWIFMAVCDGKYLSAHWGHLVCEQKAHATPRLQGTGAQPPLTAPRGCFQLAFAKL